jgi:hypothetical protein
MLQKEAVLSLIQYSIQNLLCVKAKVHAPSCVSTGFFKTPIPLYLPTVHPGAALTRKFLHAVVLTEAEDCLSPQKGGGEPMLYIAVHRGVVKQVLDMQEPEPTLLQEGKDYTVEYLEERTERCKVCDRTYPASEIVKRDGEQLCQQCDDDKYPIKPEDIPF